MSSANHNAQREDDSLARVRHYILTSLHIGRLKPGGRAPSVRRLADLTGLNRKTVHRAYTRLAGDGMLELRPGSGTYLAETVQDPSAEPESASLTQLLGAAESLRRLAGDLDMPPDRLTAFLDIFLSQGYRNAPLVVTECNREQLGLIALDVVGRLGVRVDPVLLSRLERRGDPASSSGILTTDCHHAEVIAMNGSDGPPVYRVALDSDFPIEIVAHAKQGPVCMVVSDALFEGVFLRLLRTLSVPQAVLDRIRIQVPTQMERDSVSAGATVHISPLLDEGTIPLAGAGRVLRTPWRIDPNSLERLKASLSIDLATGRLARSGRAVTRKRRDLQNLRARDATAGH